MSELLSTCLIIWSETAGSKIQNAICYGQSISKDSVLTRNWNCELMVNLPEQIFVMLWKGIKKINNAIVSPIVLNYHTEKNFQLYAISNFDKKILYILFLKINYSWFNHAIHRQFWVNIELIKSKNVTLLNFLLIGTKDVGIYETLKD